jgi:hypothetical protein
MLDKMYEINMLREIDELSRQDFPGLVKACRELMGLKQYACSDYLGMEQPRYKKLELGRFKEPIELWEMTRLESFFKLPDGMLQKKQDQFLASDEIDRKAVCKDIWGKHEGTAGERLTSGK